MRTRARNVASGAVALAPCLAAVAVASARLRARAVALLPTLAAVALLVQLLLAIGLCMAQSVSPMKGTASHPVCWQYAPVPGT